MLWFHELHLRIHFWLGRVDNLSYLMPSISRKERPVKLYFSGIQLRLVATNFVSRSQRLGPEPDHHVCRAEPRGGVVAGHGQHRECVRWL